MFWDRTSNTWSMYARHLPQLAAGRTYELWLITKAGKKIPAGTFQPSPVGTAHVETTFDLGHAPLAVVAVTEEPAGGVESPTGPIVIAGSPLTLK
jgi:anti-sigma-K factor RskA